MYASVSYGITQLTIKGGRNDELIGPSETINYLLASNACGWIPPWTTHPSPVPSSYFKLYHT